MLFGSKKFKCYNGKTYKFPVKHCVFCEHCPTILYDFTNGPYMFFCEKGFQDFRTCESFQKEARSNDRR